MRDKNCALVSPAEMVYGRKFIGSCSQCDRLFRLNCRKPLREIGIEEAKALFTVMQVQLS